MNVDQPWLCLVCSSYFSWTLPVAVGLAEGAIGDKQSAIPPGDACNASLVVPPIESEAERVDIVGCGFVDVGRGDLRDSSGERHGIVGFIVARARAAWTVQEHEGLSSGHKFPLIARD